MRVVTGLALLGLAVLTGCGTPQEQCVNRSTREIRTLQRLLDEVNANLARGYAWEEYETIEHRWEPCRHQPPVPVDAAGNPIRVRPKMCFVPERVTNTRRVAIDPVAEMNKRDGLVAKIKELTPQAEANIAACRVAYPE